MPLVFVHGVNVRDDMHGKPADVSSAYRRHVSLRDRMFRAHLYNRYAYNPIGIRDPVIRNPYWGHLGVEFKFNHASLPGEPERLGGGDEELADMVAGTIVGRSLAPTGLDETRLLKAVALKSPEDLMDLVFLAGADAALSEDDLERLAELSVLATRLEGATRAQLLARVKRAGTPEDVRDALRDALRAVEQEVRASEGVETLGLEDDPVGPFQDLSTRFLLALPRVVGRLGGALGRKPGHKAFATVVGDVVKYVKDRGDRDDMGEIPKIILRDLHAASQQRTDADPLIVVAHSMGGNIVYDIVTHFDPDLNIDVFVTVGSQVGLFEEASLFRASQPATGSKVAKPAKLGRWLNVYDPADVLGYSIMGVFDGVDAEEELSTGWGLAFSHVKYFVTPKLFKRIAEFVRKDDRV